MNVVDKIIKRKKEMLDQGLFPSSPPAFFEKKGGGFSKALTSPGISLIGEIKQSSPSAGRITYTSVRDLAGIYSRSPVRCISVLTEDKYFGGSTNNISKVKEITSKPVLMKDFIICREQIYLAAGCGADAVLLISTILNEDEIKDLNRVAQDCRLDAINEIHSREDLKKLYGCGADIKITGVNSRNLRTLEVDRSLHRDLLSLLGGRTIKVAESGIKTLQQLRKLEEMGYDAVLIGESVLKSAQPEKKIKELTDLDSC